MYDYKFHPEAEKELAKLNRSVQILFTKALKKILKSPELGLDLGHKNSLDLSGLKKMYFDNKRYRIVYEVLEDEILIHLVAIGKRDKMDVYRKAGERVEKE
ncbi:MAG: type II toxin-antitoxin system RelE/ParE family toxin [Epsilonproteobacteria bacterium]|nr:type II toxin-antitoxin system RelE/ParE family toxin [Campylobacterota bacterium]